MEFTAKGFVTEGEYLALEAEAQVRHELFHGNIVEIPGGTVYHEMIVINLALLLKAICGNLGFHVFASGFKLKASSDKFFYPDVMLTNEVFKSKLFASDPIFVAEILSPATRTYDMVDKFLAYRNLPSLKYYLLIEPEYYHATLYFKQDNGAWQAETYRKLTEQIQLPALALGLPLAEIYKGLEWD